MPLTALLLLLAAAPEPALPPSPTVLRAPSFSAGASTGSLYGLRLAGGGVHLAAGETYAWSDRSWTWGWNLGGGVGRAWTPAGLAVTDVAADFTLHVGGGPARLGAGAELRAIHVERRTSTADALLDVRFDPVAFLAVDVFRSGRTTAFLEARGYGLATLAWTMQVMAGVRL